MALGQIREIAAADADLWDAFVAAHPLGSAFVTWLSRSWWQASDWDLRPLALFDGGKIVAGLALSTKRVPWVPRRLARIQAILVDEKDPAERGQSLLAAAEQACRSRGVIEVGTRLNILSQSDIYKVPYDELLADGLARSSYVATGYCFGTYLIALDADDQALLQSFAKKCRHDVRRGLSRGVQVACSENPEDFRAFAEIHRAMSLRKGLVPPQDAVYQALQLLFARGYLRLFVARYEGRICNTVLVDVLGTPRGLLSAASDVVMEKGIPPTGEAMRFVVLQYLRDHGARYFDFGGAPGPVPVEGHPNYTVWRFKYGFGGRFVETMPVYRRSFGRISHRLLEWVRQARGHGHAAQQNLVDPDEALWLPSTATGNEDRSKVAEEDAAPVAQSVDQLEVDPESGPEKDLWDALVSSHPCGTALALSGSRDYWRAFGWRPTILATRQDGHIVAGAAVAIKNIFRSPWTVARVNALLLDPQDPAGSAGALMRAAEARALESRSLVVQVQCPIIKGVCGGESDCYEAILGVLRRSGYVESGPDSTYIVDIARNDEKLLASFSSSCRRDIRKGLREGVSVSGGEGDAKEWLDAFFGAYRQLFARKGIEPISPRQCEAVRRLCAQRGMKIFGASHEGRLCNMAIIDILGVPRYRLGAVTEAGLQSGTPPTGQVLHYEIMRWLRARDRTLYDLGGSPGPIPIKGHPNYGVWRFKHEFGGQFMYYLPWHYRTFGLAGRSLMDIARRLQRGDA